MSLAALLAFVGVLALGLAAMRDASDLAFKATLTATLMALLVGLLGAIVSRGDGAWVGFALFGWAYALAALMPAVRREILPGLLTTTPLERLAERLHDVPPEPPDLPFQVVIAGEPIPELVAVPPGPEPIPPPTASPPVPIQPDDALGKIVDGKFRTLSAAEKKLFDEYNKQAQARTSRFPAMQARIKASQEIGHRLLALIFAAVGAGIGRFLAARRPTTHATVR